MPNPLHNYKINGKMKCFTEKISSIACAVGNARYFILLLLFSSLLGTQKSYAQCDILLTTNRPNDTLEVFLNPSGEFTLNHNVLFGGAVTSSFVACDSVLIFSNNDPSNLTTIPGNDTTFFCTDLGNIFTFFVAMTDASAPLTVDTLSQKKRILVKVSDDILPVIDVSPQDTALNCLWHPMNDASYSSLVVTENCPAQITDTSYVDSLIHVSMGDTCTRIRRIWSLTTQNQGVVTDTQYLYIRDTIGNYWDTLKIKTAALNDSLVWTSDSTLAVLIDTSASKTRFNFWSDTTQFKPAAADYCLGTSTPIGPDSVNVVGLDTISAGCYDTLLYVFNAIDRKGNLTGSGSGAGMGTGVGVGDFYLSLIVKDITPPVVVTKPFDPLSANVTNLNGISMDSFLVYVDSGMCHKAIDSSMIRIIANDAISKDKVEYKWRVDSLNGMTKTTVRTSPTFTNGPTGGTYSQGYNAATGNYYIGNYEVTYFFRDTTCNSVDSFKVGISVRTWPPILTQSITDADSKVERVVTVANGADSVFVAGASNLCGVMLDSAALHIVAQDTFENDTILYRWKVHTLTGTNIAGNGTNPDTMSGIYSIANNAAVLHYPVGAHELTYLFRDKSPNGCYNTDSVKYIIVVRDTMGTQIVNYPNSTPFGTNTTLTVDATIGGCSESVTFREPTRSNFRNCANNALAGVTIQRKFVSGPDTDVFDGKPGVDPIISRDLVAIFPVGTTVFRYIFRDNIGTTDSIDMTVIVTDQEKPVAVCPVGNQTLSRSTTDCMATLPDYTRASTDNCALDTVFQYPPVGTQLMNDTTVKLVVVDGSGNKDSCEFTVTVLPLAPIPLVNPLPTLTTQCNTIDVVAPRALVNCMDTVYAVPLGRGVDISSNPPTYRFTVGESMITWFYTGLNGQDANQIQNIVFSPDTTPPITQCSSNVTLYLDTMGMVIIKASDLDSLSSDNCTEQMNLKFSVSLDSIQCDSVNKTFPVSLYVEDEAGNRDTCTSNVTIKDMLAPIFLNVPADSTISCDASIPGQDSLGFLENCMGIDTMYMDTISTRKDTTGGLTMAQLVRDSAYHNYDIIYRWIAEDKNGNRDTVQQRIRVRDMQAPALNISNPLLVSSTPDATDCSASVNFNLLTGITDNCSDTVFTAVNFMDGNGFISDTTNISLTVPMGRDSVIIRSRDIVGNVSLDTLVIVVDDKTAPRPVCVNAISITVNPLGYVVLRGSDINRSSSDNCTAANNLSIKLDRDTFRCADVGKTFTVTMTVTDEAGNFAGCSSQVTIQDFAGAGSFGCPNDTTVVCGTDISPENIGFPSVVDVCATNSIDPPKDDTLTAVGNACISIRRTWTARDTFGNPTTCTQMIHLIDTIAPVMTTTYNDTLVTCIGDAITSDSIQITDNCAATYYSVAKDTAIMMNDTILYRRIWTATDGCNTVVDTQNITVVDKVAPAIALESDTFTYNTSEYIPDSCGVFVTIDFSQFVTDCNSKLGLTVRHSDPTNDTTAILSRYLTVGLHVIQVTATDASGNMATKNVFIDINDTSTPTIVCVENLVVSLGTGGSGMLEVANVLSSVNDNCGGLGSIDTIFLSQTNFDCSDLGMNQITLTARDTSGNEGSCMVNVEVVNNGNTDIISIATASQDETLSGVKDGRAWVTVTGGSGNYTVQWDNLANSTTDTISNLAAGLYMVVVNDATTGCRLTDTVRVNEGGLVGYEVCNATGLPNTTIQVPIKVTNFTNVVSIDMSFNIANTAVAQFIDGNPASGFNVGTVNVGSFTVESAGRLLFSGNLDPATGETKPDGTVIFNLNIQLTGAMSDSTIISIQNNNNANVETGILVNGSPISVGAGTIDGIIRIGTPPPPNMFGGTITLENGTPLDSVTVYLTGTVTDTTETNPSGEYGFTVTTGQIGTVRPKENENARNGLSVSDLVAIEDHILRQDTLDSPYKMIAADVNNTQSITISDLVDIESVILRQIDAFPSMNSWRFIPASHVFDPMNPWATSIPDSISEISDTANFIGVKLGDVTLTANKVNFDNQGTTATSRDVFRFGVQDQILEEGAVIEVPFKATQFEEMLAYQMTLDVDPAWLSFENVMPGALDQLGLHNFGLNNANRGMISTLWYQSTPLSVEQSETLFTLTFRVNKGGKKLSEVLGVSSNMISAEAHAENTAPKGIQLAYEGITEIVAEGFELFQNKPNPFNKQTTISFTLPEASAATLRFYDFGGRMIHQIKGDYVAGSNNVVVDRKDLSAVGVLYYELETPTNTARKKMIILE